MRWYWQLAVIAVLGGAGYGAWENWDTVKANMPEAVAAALSPPKAVGPGGPPAGGAPAGGARPAGGAPQGQASAPQTSMAAAPAAPAGAPQRSGPPGPNATASAPAAGSAPAGQPRGGGGGPGGGAPLVEVAAVGTGQVVEIAEAVGTTRAFESITVTTKTSGIIESVNFEEGQTVEAGHEIIRLDRAERRADLEATKAAILQEEARRNEVKTKLERAMALRRSGAGTEALVDDLTAQMRTADSAVQAAIARQRAAEARLNDLVIRAPFTGRVGVRSVSVGALVEPRTVVTTLDDVSKIRLDFAVPENLIARLSVGSPVSAKAVAFGGRTFPGEVAVVDTRVDPVTRSVRMTAVLDNASGTLKPGMFVNVSVEVARRDNAILIPEEAVVGEGPQQLAFVVVDGRVERRSLTIGQRQDGKVEVKEGLKAGETLVVRGVQRVRPGAPVTTRPVGAAGQGGPGQGAPRAPGQGAPGPSGAGQGGAGQGGAGQGGSLPGPAAPANAPSAAIPAAPGPAAQVQGGSAVPPSTVR